MIDQHKVVPSSEVKGNWFVVSTFCLPMHAILFSGVHNNHDIDPSYSKSPIGGLYESTF